MGFESQKYIEEENHLPEAPMSKEVLRLKNDIQFELIKASIELGDDVEEYPMKWIQAYSEKFHQVFTELLKKYPDLISDWEDEGKREDITALFKRKLYLHLDN